MQEGTIPFSEVQALYELCTFSTDLKKFCKDIGVSYDGYVKWRQRLRYDETIGKTVETEPPAASQKYTEKNLRVPDIFRTFVVVKKSIVWEKTAS